MLRILTYNVRGGWGIDNLRSIERVGEVVQALQPDIICFQEIHRRLPQSAWKDQPRILAEALRREFSFQRNVRFGLGQYGIGIAFRGELIARREHMLPSGREQRGALELQITGLMARPLTIFCTHWGLTAEERLEQAASLAELTVARPGPVVAAGDFNEQPDGPAVQRFRKLSGLEDCDSVRNRATFVSQNPTERIDYVWISRHLTAARVEIVDSPASDHCGVLVDLAEDAQA